MIDLVDWETLKSLYLATSYVVSAIRESTSAAGFAVMGGWLLVTVLRR